MNTETNKFIHSKLFLTSMIITLILITIITGTYAWFTWSSEENTNLTMTIGNLADATFISGNDITTGLTPVFNYTDGESTTFIVKNNDVTGSSAYYNVILNITTIPTELRRTDVKYVLTKNGTVVTEGDMSSVVDGTSITLYTSPLDAGTVNYVFYLYIDGNDLNDSNMIGKTIVGELTAGQIEDSTISLGTHITNLYTTNKDDANPVKNNSIEYRYASSVGLMNDRLGGTTADYDAGNIRFYGASPNNYIYFNCKNYPYTDCEVWRIIGLFKNMTLKDGSTTNLIKIVKQDTIGNYSFDNKTSDIGTSISSYGSNNWDDARLMMLLNPGYEEGVTADDGDVIYGFEGSLYWNSRSGTCYYGSSNATTSCDFTSKGIKNDTTKSMIKEVVWNLGGYTSTSTYPNKWYEYERGISVYSGHATEWPGKVGLIYISDYMYATDFNKCTTYSYNTTNCYTNDWLYKSSSTWTLTPYTSTSTSSNYAYNQIYYSSSISSSYSRQTYAVHPTVYISADTLVSTIGDGSSKYPYMIVNN